VREFLAVLIHDLDLTVTDHTTSQEVTMYKSNTSTSGKTKSAPDQLSKTGKKAGIELTESQLGQASGGEFFPVKHKLI
jgi:hypothetical protein